MKYFPIQLCNSKVDPTCPALMTNSLPDEMLCVQVQKGDKEVFGELVDRYQKKLIRYGRKFLFSSENIEDLVQDVFIKAYQNMQSFDTKQKFSPWIYRIAHNTFINELKKHARTPLSLFDFDTLIPHLAYDDPATKEREQKEMRLLIDQSLQKLAPKYREIIVLYFLEELNYKEIADILHIPTGTVGIRLTRAKKQLKKYLPADALSL
jgi:RNA polymerase sigma-70 factor (ECF subfamily)